MERQPRVAAAYPAWKRAAWRFAAGIAYVAASALYDVGAWAMGHIPECRLSRERADRVWKAIQWRTAGTGTEVHSDDD